MDQTVKITAGIPRLRRYARALVGDRAAADDLIQDTLERAWAKISQFRVGSDMRAWMFSIMHNLHINQVRSKREYEDPRGRRLTLYLKSEPKASDTAFRFVDENGGSVFYWVDRDFGYALSGTIDKPRLLEIATAVYGQVKH